MRIDRGQTDLKAVRELLGDTSQRHVPAEDRATPLTSPAEAFLEAAEPETALANPLTADEPIFHPWEPTGNETPQKTVEMEKESQQDWSVPPPETAGGSIPSAFARFRQFGPDES